MKDVAPLPRPSHVQHKNTTQGGWGGWTHNTRGVDTQPAGLMLIPVLTCDGAVDLGAVLQLDGHRLVAELHQKPARREQQLCRRQRRQSSHASLLLHPRVYFMVLFNYFNFFKVHRVCEGACGRLKVLFGGEDHNIIHFIHSASSRLVVVVSAFLIRVNPPQTHRF